MKKAIIGKKVGMTQIFDEAGKVHSRHRHRKPAPAWSCRR